jgi:hypothetical protein
MIEEKLTIGLVIERIAPDSQWSAHHWLPRQVFAVPPETPSWTALAAGAGRTLYYAGEHHVTLYSTDTANYRDNLESGQPRLWVVLRPDGDEPPVEVAAVTADPAEGEAHTEASGNKVETVAMPDEIAARIAAFIEAHHVERPRIKRQRDRGRPDLARSGAGADRRRRDDG